MKHLNITLRHLRTFIIVARQGSFNLAAQELSRTQPAVTLAIKQLEEFVGIKLLERTTRSVAPTNEGENFLPIAERLVRDFDSAIYDLRATAERRVGHVSIAIVPSVATNLLPPIIKTFSNAYPGINLHLDDDSSRGVQQRVERNEVDFGVGSMWQAKSKPRLYTAVFRSTAAGLPSRSSTVGRIGPDRMGVPWKMRRFSTVVSPRHCAPRQHFASSKF